MVDEAKMVEQDGGRMPATDGWYVLNVADGCWRSSKDFGSYCQFEGEEAKFQEIGMHVHVLQPDQPACRYHSETVQENFLVLSGECRVILEEEERPLKAWDFVHCPPGTRHVFVGAGDGPCAILMIGARGPDKGLRYPVSEVAGRYGASVSSETANPAEAYADCEWGKPVPAPPWPLG